MKLYNYIISYYSRIKIKILDGNLFIDKSLIDCILKGYKKKF